MFAKVCQKCLQKWAKNCCKSAPKKLFCKSAPKQCFAKVCQSVAKCTKTFSKLAFFRILSLSQEPGERGFTYLQVVPVFGGAKQVMTSDIIKCTSFYTFPWPPNKKVNPKYLPLFPTVTSSIIKPTFISFLVKSWGSEASPLATHTFKRSYKISHPPQL